MNTIGKIICASVLLTSSLFAATAPPQEMLTPPLMSSKNTSSSSYIMVPLKDRATDMQQAFDQLKREKTTGKVYFQLADGTTISNIIDMNLMTNNSLFLFRYNTSNNQGIRLQVVKVEDIVGLSYY